MSSSYRSNDERLSRTHSRNSNISRSSHKSKSRKRRSNRITEKRLQEQEKFYQELMEQQEKRNEGGWFQRVLCKVVFCKEEDKNADERCSLQSADMASDVGPSSLDQEANPKDAEIQAAISLLKKANIQIQAYEDQIAALEREKSEMRVRLALANGDGSDNQVP
mmetsp:Transcript_36204/g.47746  ORF Transcript_36204/g.47746 Transcript_36204/m.47746 type:complete len:164 (+) Transcript_36204:75-566(+)